MSELGDRYNKGKPGIHLLPMDALVELAKVYDYGSEKYTKRYNNLWQELQETVSAVKIELHLSKDYVVVATINNLNETILIIEKDNEKITSVGNLLTLIKSKDLKKNMQDFDELILLKEKEIGIQRENFGSKNLELQKNFYKKNTLKDALSVVQPNTYTLITTIRQGSTEEYYVVNTTTASGSLMMMLENLTKLLNIYLPEERLVRSTGKHNWAKGLKWNEGCGASLLRHYERWSGGELVDKESGLPHDLHIAWNAITLIALRLRKIGEDDRHKIYNNTSDTDSSAQSIILV